MNFYHLARRLPVAGRQLATFRRSIARPILEQMTSAHELPSAAATQTPIGAAGRPGPTSNELAVLHALSMASQAFTGTRHLEAVLDGLLESVLHLAQADAGSIMLVSPKGDMLRIVAARGARAEQIIGLAKPLEHSVSGFVLRQDRTVVLEGRTDERQGADAGQPVSAYPRDLASSVVMPLRGRSRVLGVLSASRAPGTPRMDPSTVHLLELLGSQAAILIDNAQLAERETSTLRERAQLLDLAFEAILVRDLTSGAVSFWNPGAEVLYGWTQAEAAHLDLHTAVATQFADPRADIELRLARDGKWEGELVQTRRDGSQVIVSSRWALQRDGAGQPVAVLEINRDITLQKKAAAELQQTLTQLKRQYQEVSMAHSRVQAVLDATSEAIALVAADNTTLSVNRRFAELFLPDTSGIPESYPYQQFLLRTQHVFEDAAGFQSLLDEILVTPDAELRRIVVQSWPKRRELDLYSTPVRDTDGTRMGRLFVFRDVSLEQAADRAKTEFVSMISHELRTPLTSINGYVDLLLDDEFGKLNSDQWSSLRVVRRNGDNLLALINDLLDVTRVMAGTITVRPVTIDLAEVIQAAVETLRPQMLAKGQTLTVDVPPGLEPMRGDPQRLRQVFVNLLSNAHKYTAEGGQLWLTVGDHEHTIQVDVKDSGIGMTPDEKAQLFTKFFRADNPVTRQVGGTGLGLVITRSLVELHGGSISVATEPGQGTTFSVMLPTWQAADALDQNARQGSPDQLMAGGFPCLEPPVEQPTRAA